MSVFLHSLIYASIVQQSFLCYLLQMQKMLCVIFFFLIEWLLIYSFIICIVTHDVD